MFKSFVLVDSDLDICCKVFTIDATHVKIYLSSITAFKFYIFIYIFANDLRIVLRLVVKILFYRELI